MKSTLIVTTTSAVALTPQQVKKITQAVENKNKGRKIELKQIIDLSVIGGLKITVGSQEIDATVYTKLEKLHLQLKSSL